MATTPQYHNFVLYRVDRALFAVIVGSRSESEILAQATTTLVRRIGAITIRGALHFTPQTYAIFLTKVNRDMFGVRNGTVDEANASRTFDRHGFCTVKSQ